MKQKYAIRVYKAKYSFDKYDDYIYMVPEVDVDANDILVESWADTIQEVIKEWNILIDKYEGFTYCVKDVYNDEVLIGGVFDPGDIEYLEEYEES
jgi:hypothetical protein